MKELISLCVSRAQSVIEVRRLHLLWEECGCELEMFFQNKDRVSDLVEDNKFTRNWGRGVTAGA